MTTPKEQHQRPEGALLEAALSGPPKMSVRKLAKRAELSEGRVRQIINGYQSQAGQMLKIVGPPATIARLAAVLGISPEQLDAAGREDAGEALRQRQRRSDSPPYSLPFERDRDELLRELREWVESDSKELPPTETIHLFNMTQMHQGLGESIADMHQVLEGVSAINWRNLHRLRVLEGGGDGDADDTGGSAANKTPEAGPAQQPAADDYGLAAHDDPDNPPGAADDD